ncbi:MAG: ATP synthase F1 subunit epsilon [Candidatus Levybacteria bacterium RIFCSPLOWO2_01_FULL_36_13]|nr:MAG: ATP synthase F1 subunit epsilon [Candidatus Levybacteria bacterium RIFCSPHIGHO2_01_FULL_36_15b]OGH35578.1 MAG: ATP synthase F1 subunit epsilon [Candidatus Levybacteria bacterium RIFCSPLOWO2_01_FULL_36_13]
MKIFLKVITPVKTILSEEVDEITVPTHSGVISILPNHVDLLTKVSPGEMFIKTNGKIDNFAITGGFLEVSKNKVNILADYAVRASNIEIAKAKEAQARAEKAMKEKEGSKEFIIAEAELRKAILELKIANRRRNSL